jgi:hypothetical protein
MIDHVQSLAADRWLNGLEVCRHSVLPMDIKSRAKNDRGRSSLVGAGLGAVWIYCRNANALRGNQARTSPDHAPREAFSHLFRAGARGRSDQLIGAIPLTMQRVWG